VNGISGPRNQIRLYPSPIRAPSSHSTPTQRVDWACRGRSADDVTAAEGDGCLSISRLSPSQVSWPSWEGSLSVENESPAPGSRTADSSNDPTNQEVINSSRETPIHRSLTIPLASPLWRGSGYEQAKAKLCYIEADELAVAFGLPA
jgi:hypothetical protein